jgi:hypothetical protein
VPVNYHSVIGYVSFIFAISGPVSAQQVHKCVQGAETVYQSRPCEPGQTIAKSWDASPYAPASSAERQRVRSAIEATRRRDAELRAGNTSYGSGALVNSGVDACEAAKRQRDKSIYDAGPGNVSMGTRRGWDAFVASRCK